MRGSALIARIHLPEEANTKTRPDPRRMLAEMFKRRRVIESICEDKRETKATATFRLEDDTCDRLLTRCLL